MQFSLAQSGIEKKSHLKENWTAVDAPAFVRYLGSWSLGRGSLQQKLARALSLAVRNGRLTPGMRLPSERNLAQALMVSRTTVVGAYEALRESGWVESRPGSGTWVCPSSRVVAEARGAGRDAALNESPLFHLLGPEAAEDQIDFTLGVPMPLDELPQDLLTLPAEEYAAMVRDSRYYPLGLATLRKALARMYSQEGLDTSEDQVLITNGAQSAISLCAGLYLQHGDAVLMEDPGYFGALDAFRAAGARLTPLPVGPDGVHAAVVRERLKSTAARLVYVTSTFQNPTGAVMPAGARKELGRIMAESGVPVIDDTTLADIRLEGSPPPPLAAFAREAPVITIGSLSKLVWHGLRVGWVRAPAWIVERLARVKSSIDLASPVLTQAIAVRLIEEIATPRRLRREQLKPRRDLLASLLRKQLPDWDFRIPEGGLFFWARLPRGDTRELAQIALRHGVILLPGSHTSAVGRHEAYLRIPFLADAQILRAGVRRIAAAWRDYQSHRQPATERVLVV